MNFWDYQADEREQWRKQDITRAYLVELRRLSASGKDTCISAIRDGVLAPASHWAGVVEGMNNAVTIAEEDK
jgi:hypothetical protein